MRITALEFSNHRFIPDLRIEVRRHLVIVGPNEAGKTSLLRSLDAALGSGRQQLHAVFSTDMFRDPDTPLTLRVTFGDFDDSDRASFADEINVEREARDEDEEPVEVERLTLLITALNEGDDVSVVRAFEKPGVDRVVRREHLDAIGWAFLPAGRSPERELGVGRSSALRSLLSSLELGTDEARITEMLRELNSQLDGTDAVAELRARLATDLTLLYPRVVEPEALVARVTGASDNDPRTRADIHMRVDEGESRPLHRQSDGLRSLSTIVVQRLARAASLLGIDEPEVHLHPRSQARLAALLAAGEQQCVVATHSTAVLTAFEPEHAVALVPGGVRQLGVSRAHGRRFHAQWWIDTALEPLTARGAILVEGPSDRVLLRRTANLLGFDLDREGYAVVVANGAPTFKPLLTLFGEDGFDIRLCGLVDEDEMPLVAGKLGVTATRSALRDRSFEVSSPDLEEESVRGLGVERHLDLIAASGEFDRATVLGRFRARSAGEIDVAGYVQWCRGRKLEIAVALGMTMTEADAPKLESIARLVHLMRASA